MTAPYSFPNVLDSTIMVTSKACLRKAQYSFLHSLHSPRKSTDLHFGGAFARAMEVGRKEFFLHGRTQSEATTRAVNAAWDFYGDFDAGRTESDLKKKPKSLRTLLRAVDGYFKRWPLGDCGLIPYNDNQGIEFTFAIPLPDLTHPDHGGPVLYGGRFDLLGQWNSLPTITDEKTAGSFPDNWISQWGLRYQFLGYVWAARQYGIPVEQILIRGIAIKVDSDDYLDALQIFPDYMISRWYAQLIHDIRRLISAYKSGYFDYDFGDACTSYGGCVYADLCRASSPTSWFDQYVYRPWFPTQQNPEKE